MISTDTSCILAWLIEQGYEVIAFMADVGQEEVWLSFTLDGWRGHREYSIHPTLITGL